MRGAVVLALSLAGCGRLGFDDSGERTDAASDAQTVPMFEISLRGFHACALLETGRVSCWGANGLGELGRGVTSPTETQGYANVSDIVHVVTGEGDTFAIDRAGRLWAWGSNLEGELGWGANDVGQLGIKDPGTTGSGIPVSIPMFAGTHVDDLEVGCGGACARMGTDVYCWGENDTGSVGNHTLANQFAPVKIDVVPP